MTATPGARTVVWINGTFGAGKTTTAAALRELRPDLRHYDPEWVGYLLRAHLSDLPFDDFQDLPPWRELVPVVAQHIAALTGDDLLAVQTVLVRGYWDDLQAGLAASGLHVVHVLLDASADALRARIEGDEVEVGAREWRLDHLDDYAEARTWLLEAADLVVDTSVVTPAEAAAIIAAHLQPPA